MPGLKLNSEKTKVIWIGSRKYSAHSIKTGWKLAWGNIRFKVLGVWFDVDLDTMISQNYNDKTEKMRKFLISWKKRYLSIFGRVAVIKSLIIPQFNIHFSTLPDPDAKILNTINNHLNEFLLNGVSRIKHIVLTKDYPEGGVRMINLKAFMDSIKKSWIRRCIQDNAKWINLLNQYFNITKLVSSGKHYVDKLILKIDNPFWRDMLSSFSHFLESSKVTSFNTVINEPLFYNHNFLIVKQSIFY